jgi:hypothetical protein
VNRVFVRAALAIAPILAVAAAPAPGKMAPLSSYLMNRQAEITLVRSSAPASIADHATILVLGPHGYVVASKGNNGFTCLDERGWTQPFDAKTFWDPAFAAPTCYNAEAVRTILPYTFERTKLVLAGASKNQVMAHITAAIKSGALPSPAPGSMAYMMSKRQYIGSAKQWYPHLMFFAPQADGANGGLDWGANRRLSPVVFDSIHHLDGTSWAQFFVPVPFWSDGTPAPLYLAK